MIYEKNLESQEVGVNKNVKNQIYKQLEHSFTNTSDPPTL